MYRGLGKEGAIDALQSGVFRPKQSIELPKMEGVIRLNKAFNKTYFTNKKNFSIVKSYNPTYIAEVPETAAQFSRRYGNKKDWSWHTTSQIPVEQGTIYKKDWLKGYKPIKEMPISFKQKLKTV
jgi:hypothetical protein